MAPRDAAIVAVGAGAKSAVRLRMTSGIERHAFWMRTSRGWRSSWLHLPGGSTRRAGGVVVCPPLGHEYTHSYRTLLSLADELAAAGIVTLRFDYCGCGSSMGDAVQMDLVGAWVEDVRAATELIRGLAGGPVSVVGLRLGATLAGAAAPRCQIEHLVAWAPVLSGRRFLREQRALAEVGRQSHDADVGLLEAGGFVLSRETASELASIDLAKQGFPVRGRALVVERDDLPAGSGLPVRLRNDGVPTEVLTTSGYVAMMDKPHRTVVPTETIALIVRWLEAHAPSEARGALRLPPEQSVVTLFGAVLTAEELVHVAGAHPLFGVLTRPLIAPLNERPLLLLTNGGSAHNVGPNRLYVEISRKLAAAGVASLRLDLRNLGDSIRGHPAEENHPYPATAMADIARAVEWLREERGVERVVLGGLCSGAYHALRSGLTLPHAQIEGLLLINPLTFRWTKGSVILDGGDAAPHASIRDRRKWRRLMSGRYDLPHVLRFVGGAIRARAVAASRYVVDRVGLLPPRSLDRELGRCIAAGRRIDFVYSRCDPGYGLLRASTSRVLDRLEESGALSITLIDSADHSFSRRAWRQDLVDRIDERLGHYGRADLSRPASWRSSMERALATASS